MSSQNLTLCNNNEHHLNVSLLVQLYSPYHHPLFTFKVQGRVVQSVGHLTLKVRGPRFDTQSGNILAFLLPLFQEGQLSVTGKSMCTKYWLTA